MVAFFAVRGQKNKAPFRYWFCALCTVEKTIRQTDIWTNEEFRAFRNYSNLLIERGPKGKWIHSEREGIHHDDWLWRIADHNLMEKKKSAFKAVEREDSFLADQLIAGRVLRVASNYVIFSRDKQQTAVLKKPIVVAICNENGRRERWKKGAGPQSIRRLTLGEAKRVGSRRTSLRSPNTEHSHPAIHLRMPIGEAVEWRARLLAELSPKS